LLGARRPFVAVLCCALPLRAVDFKELSTQRQRNLQLFAKEWEGFTPEKQERLRKGVDRWLNMSPEQRGPRPKSGYKVGQVAETNVPGMMAKTLMRITSDRKQSVTWSDQS
jgi:hypothetical protein